MLESNGCGLAKLPIGVMPQGLHEQRMLVAEGLIQAALVQSRRLAQVRERCGLVAHLPEDIHCGLECLLLIELPRLPDGPFFAYR